MFVNDRKSTRQLSNVPANDVDDPRCDSRCEIALLKMPSSISPLHWVAWKRTFERGPGESL